MPKKKLLVFLSHASEDKIKVRKLFKRLKEDGFDPWMDKDRLLPGQDWKFEIEQALSKSDAILLCFSENAVSKESFIQREFKRAMEYQEEKPEGEIFVIPVRLDQCDVPQFIKDRQWVDFPTQYKKLWLALTKRQTSLAIKNKHPQKQSSAGLEKRMTISPDLLSKATEEINKKKSQMPQMRPDYEIGDPTELKSITSKSGTTAIVQFYKNGMISWYVNGKHKNQTFATYGGIYSYYRNLGKLPWKIVGLPVTDENDSRNSPHSNFPGRYSSFENGEIVWYKINEHYSRIYGVLDPIRNLYDSMKGSGSYLGFPISKTYKIKNGQRSDFEGGSIVSFNNGKGTHAVRQLLRIDYTDSPINHDWELYSGANKNPDFVSARLETKIGLSKNSLEFNSPWDRRAIRYPSYKSLLVTDGDLRIQQKYCGVTIRSLEPRVPIRFYLRIKMSRAGAQYLQYDYPGKLEKQFFLHDSENVDYWCTPLPAECADGEWHTVIVNLQQSVQNGFTETFEWLKGFHFRELIGIADLLTSDSSDAIEAVALSPILVK